MLFLTRLRTIAYDGSTRLDRFLLYAVQIRDFPKQTATSSWHGKHSQRTATERLAVLDQTNFRFRHPPQTC